MDDIKTEYMFNGKKLVPKMITWKSKTERTIKLIEDCPDILDEYRHLGWRELKQGESIAVGMMIQYVEKQDYPNLKWRWKEVDSRFLGIISRMGQSAYKWIRLPESAPVFYSMDPEF